MPKDVLPARSSASSGPSRRTKREALRETLAPCKRSLRFGVSMCGPERVPTDKRVGVS